MLLNVWQLAEPKASTVCFDADRHGCWEDFRCEASVHSHMSWNDYVASAY